MDVAKIALDMDIQDEDLGQTLAFYGFGHGIYLNWPFLGPSSIRDTLGWAGDLYFDPLNYAFKDYRYSFAVNLAVRGYDRVNTSSLKLGEYEAFKRAALDPYVAMRDAYVQYRVSRIKE